MNKTNTVRIFGVPMDLGQQRLGVDMGPSAVRYAGLQNRLRGLGYDVYDHGNVAIPLADEVLQSDQHGLPVAEGNARHIQSVAQVCNAIYSQMTEHVAPGDFAIFLGGDHSISMGSVPGAVQRGSHGVIWVDAHGDFNTPRTSPSGNMHGMSVAALLGDGPAILTEIGGPAPRLQPSQVVMIGQRDLDTLERERLKASGITVLTMTDIDEHGIGSIARKALDHLLSLKSIHLSLDMDALDPAEAPGVGTPVRGGLTYREAHLLMEIFGQSGKFHSMDLVEINPLLDTHNRTAELAVELAASLLGQRII